jgi:zinc transporter 1/2/3
MDGNAPLSDFINACLGQNLTNENLVNLFEEALQTGTRMLDQDEDPCAEAVPTDFDLSLHIASVFIILTASSLGVAFPLVAKYNKKLNVNHYSIILGKCAGTGVILACALIHMIQPSNAALTSECVPTAFNTVYPAFAYLFALIAALAMHFLEFILSSYFVGDSNLEEIEHVIKEAQNVDDSHEFGDVEKDQNVDDSHELGDVEKDQKVNDSPQLESSSEQKRLQAKRLSEAYMVEFGVSVHSILIGLAVGVTGKDDLLALLVALIFHQAFEGVALGSRLSDTTLGIWNEVFLGAIFALSAPVGIAIGIGIYSTFNANGETFLIVQGVFDGICGGILLYTGFIFLLLDFPSDMELYCRGQHERLMKAGMFFFLWVFAGLMSLIGMFL